ncbi:hypothetical protein F2Q69_00053186 [Brassica cretica]|uniref:Uncharacterized protein n=3 Tax=Brassica TaxID=3705 RepID=A0A8S9MUA7_BRACR|nr:hypothetical protein F2Q69_00053186 [Brassica cretica]
MGRYSYSQPSEDEPLFGNNDDSDYSETEDLIRRDQAELSLERCSQRKLARDAIHSSFLLIVFLKSEDSLIVLQYASHTRVISDGVGLDPSIDMPTVNLQDIAHEFPDVEEILERSISEWLGLNDVQKISLQDLPISDEPVTDFASGLYRFVRTSQLDDHEWPLVSRRKTREETPLRFDLSRIDLGSASGVPGDTFERQVYKPNPLNVYGHYVIAHYMRHNVGTEPFSDDDSGEDDNEVSERSESQEEVPVTEDELSDDSIQPVEDETQGEEEQQGLENEEADPVNEEELSVDSVEPVENESQGEEEQGSVNEEDDPVNEDHDVEEILERSISEWLGLNDVQKISLQDLPISDEPVTDFASGLYRFVRTSQLDDHEWPLVSRRKTREETPLRFDLSRIDLGSASGVPGDTFERQVYKPNPLNVYGHYVIAHYMRHNVGTEPFSDDDSGEDDNEVSERSESQEEVPVTEDELSDDSIQPVEDETQGEEEQQGLENEEADPVNEEELSVDSVEPVENESQGEEEQGSVNEEDDPVNEDHGLELTIQMQIKLTIKTT